MALDCMKVSTEQPVNLPILIALGIDNEPILKLAWDAKYSTSGKSSSDKYFIPENALSSIYFALGRYTLLTDVQLPKAPEPINLALGKFIDCKFIQFLKATRSILIAELAWMSYKFTQLLNAPISIKTALFAETSRSWDLFAKQ